MTEKFSFKRAHRARTIFVIFNTIILAIVGLVVLFPLVKILSDSVDRNAAVVVFRLIPSKFTMEAYKTFMQSTLLYRPFIISVFVMIVGTVLSMLLTTMYAYGLTRDSMPGKKLFSMMVVFTMMFQPGLIPMYMQIKSLGLLNSLLAILLPTSINAYYCILMRNFFYSIPPSLMEAADIDGCTPIGTFFRIVLPLSKPGMAVIGLFYIVFYWNQFFEYIIYINDSRWHNFQVVLRSMVIEDDIDQYANMTERLADETLKNAAVIIVILPLMLIYPLFQKYFARGINLGAVKG